jgi:hypothetical protein
MAAIGPLLKTLAALDRYHGFDPSPAPVKPARLERPRLPAPPLALTYAAPPLDPVSTERARRSTVMTLEPSCSRQQATRWNC